VTVPAPPPCPGSLECGGECLPRHQLCDSLRHCEDGADEAGCEAATCREDEFSCGSGRCVPASWRCDGTPDCGPSAEDEEGCWPRQTECPPDQFLCAAESRCIPGVQLCDGHADCGQAEDEAASECECGPGALRCQLGGGCVAGRARCDGQYQCADRSDEWGCLELLNNTLTVSSAGDDGRPVCVDQWDAEWSEAACVQLGHAGHRATQQRYDFTLTDAEFWVRDTARAATGAVQAAATLEGGTCRSKESVQLECEELVCGSWNLTDAVAAQLVGDTEVADLEAGAQWPALAVLFNVKRKASCTVTIFSPRWLLTSHTCVSRSSMNPLEWVVFAGPAGYNPTASESAQIKLVKTILGHPGTRRGQHLVTADLALVNIHDGLTFNSLVSPLCLAEEGVQERQLCVTAGWTSSAEGISFNQYLTYLPVPVLPTPECNSSSLYNGHVADSMLCSMANGDSRVCHTDLGSPLMCLEAGVWQLQAVLSSRGDCSAQQTSGGRPAVFTSVRDNRQWIMDTIRS